MIKGIRQKKFNSAKMEIYREQLLQFGMLEPKNCNKKLMHWLFYKPIKQYTAFVVNLTSTKEGVSVVYGYSSTAFTKFVNCENSLIDSGVSDGEISLREKVIIANDDDEQFAAKQIGDMYAKYLNLEKDELLAVVKSKRNEFIKKFSVALKPLGFKKNGNIWKKSVSDNRSIEFHLQKSLYSDSYYFNINVLIDGKYDLDSQSRITVDKKYQLDWQCATEDEIESLVNTLVEKLQILLSDWYFY